MSRPEAHVLQSSRSIQEFWIDFLLEEEFRSDAVFARSFVHACGLSISEPAIVEVTHSLCDDHGEADLVVEFLLAGEIAGSRGALLIENKITAGFQPQQAARYRARGEAGKSKSAWQNYRTVLVAPEKYIKAGHGFDVAVSLEKLSDWICSAEPSRREFKLQRIQRAIEKKNTTGVQIVDQIMTEFRQRYLDIMVERDSGFVPPAPRPAYRGDDWMEWTSLRLPRGTKFRHRTRTGMLDLSFDGVSQEAIGRLEPFLAPGVSLCTIGTGRPRGAIQMAITPITNFADLAGAEPIIRNALDAAEEMQETVIANADIVVLARLSRT